MRLDSKAAAGGLARAPFNGALADVGGGDVMSGGGEPQRLSANTASRVKHPPHRTRMPGQQAPNHLGLPPDGRVPVGKYQVVVIGQLIVEAGHIVRGHAATVAGRTRGRPVQQRRGREPDTPFSTNPRAS